MHLQSSLSIAVLIASAGLAGCEANQSQPRTVRSDSAGIAIFTSTAGRSSGWQIAPDPDLDIGPTKSITDEPVLLMPNSVHPWKKGYAVTDMTHVAVLVIDSAGELIRKLGRKGNGPGEFRLPDRLHVTGDTLWVYDIMASRITLFRDTLLAETITFPPEWRSPELVGLLPDRRLVISRDNFDGPPARHGVARYGYTVGLADPSSRIDAVDTLGTFPGKEWITYPTTTGTSSGNAPFARFSIADVWHGDIVVGTNDSYELRVFSPEGRLTRILRLEGAQQKLTGRMIARKSEGLNEGVVHRNRVMGHRVNADAFDAILQSIQWPDYMPAFSNLSVDPLDYLWVNRYAPNIKDRSVWDIFSPDGTYVGDLTLPRDSRLAYIGEDYVVLRKWDSDGIPHLWRHRLQRSH